MNYTRLAGWRETTFFIALRDICTCRHFQWMKSIENEKIGKPRFPILSVITSWMDFLTTTSRLEIAPSVRQRQIIEDVDAVATY